MQYSREKSDVKQNTVRNESWSKVPIADKQSQFQIHNYSSDFYWKEIVLCAEGSMR